MSFNIHIRVIDNERHRTPEGCKRITGADWYWDEDGDLQVRVSRMSDWRMEAALALHETAEALMCRNDSVTQESVDLFDSHYAATHTDDCEAGDDPAAPYKRQHSAATAIERVFTAHVGLDWKTYDDELELL